MTSDRVVYIVHCVDVGGPLCESLEATFERIKNSFGLEIKPSRKNLERLRRGQGIPEDMRYVLAEFVSKDRLNYNTNWKMVDAMLDEILSKKWRRRHTDDFGNGYIFNWFIMDHVGFHFNPRRRSLGYHILFEHYRKKLRQFRSVQDEMHWHCHPVSFFREAHKSSNNFSFTNEHLQVLSRRVIDYGWFPSVFRPGMHCERPDINLFLEQWIPFDYANQRIEEKDGSELQKDISGGRYGDWRRATPEWEVYHPDFYDYQIKGKMKRYIARCLNLNARLRSISKYEIEKAFRRADSGKGTIMAIMTHDEREMRPYIDAFYALVREIQKGYPRVKIKNAGAVSAIRETLKLRKENPVKFNVKFQKGVLDVKTDKPCWGPQPYFCFRTKDKQYIHENLDYHGGMHWSYTFDEDNAPINKIEAVGLATNDAYGNSTVWREFL